MVLKIITRKFKSKRKPSKSNKMAKKRKSSSRPSRKSKDVLTRVPILGGLVKNRTFQEVEKGAGRASVVARLMKIVPVQQVQTAADNPFIRAALAFTGGGFPAAVYQFSTDRGLIGGITDSLMGGNGNNQIADMGGVA